MNDLYPVAILAGGLGTRLGDLTADTPKCMVEVCGVPFIDHVLRLLRQQGAKRVVLCVGHLGWQVEQFVGDGLHYGLQVQYSWDGTKQLGTAGALSKALPLLGNNFFVLYGDSYLPCDLQAIQAAYEADTMAVGIMAVCKTPRGYIPNAWLEHGQIIEYDKRVCPMEGEHIDYGIGILAGRMALPPTMDDLSDVYAYWADSERLAGYEVRDRFHTIGTFAGLAECEEFLSVVRT